MRGTVRITWLLLTLALGVLDNVCAQDVNHAATSVSTDPSPVTSLTTVTLVNDTTVVTDKNHAAAATTTPQPSEVGVGNESMQPPTPAKQNGTLSPPATDTAATTAPTVHPVSITQATVTDNGNRQPAQPLTTTGLDGAAAGVDSPPTVATTSLPKDPVFATTAGSTGTFSGSTTGAAIATSTDSSAATVNERGVKIGVTMTQAVPTTTPRAEHLSSTQTSITLKVNQEDNTRDGNHQLTREPTGTTGSSSSTSLAQTSSPTTEILATKAGVILPLTTPIFTFTLGSTTSTITTIIVSQPKTFLYSLNKNHEKEEEEKELVKVCIHLMANMDDGNCTLVWQQHNGKVHFDCVEINGKVKTQLAAEYYQKITKKPTDSKTLIAILASCGALLIMIIILAVCASHHRKPYGENQQHLTEELHTVENGYHDNPTLEVMEVQPEMQEKKMTLNGEFNDSWIVPIDNLMKDDMPDEEDTHL